MKISWYPGHMHKARKQLAEAMRNTDVVIEVLDARAPAASTNPLLAELRGELPCIRILNKTDLADPDLTELWRKTLATQTASLCLLNGYDKRLSHSEFMAACRKLVKSSNNPATTYQILITGIPNVGKSTLLNQILDRKIARTGNEPAVTKGQQRVKIEDRWFLVDTPGMMWPRLEDQQAAYRLACLGTIRNTAIDLGDIGWFAAQMLLEDFYPQLEARYQLIAKPAGAEELLTVLARTHGCLARGGSVDWHRVSELLLDDLRSGRLGRITLETPPASETPEQRSL
jgi:ribosome biogenesis GTPase A